MRLIIIGAAGHARVIIDSIERAGDHQIAGCVAENHPGKRTFFGCPLLGGIAVLADGLCAPQSRGLDCCRWR